MGSGQNFGQLLAGMAISGAGAATGELTGLAGYVVFLVCFRLLSSVLVSSSTGSVATTASYINLC